LEPKETPSSVASKLQLRYHYTRAPESPPSSFPAKTSVPHSFGSTPYSVAPSGIGSSPRGGTGASGNYASTSKFPTTAHTSTTNYGLSPLSSSQSTSSAYGNPTKLNVPQSNYGVLRRDSRTETGS